MDPIKENKDSAQINTGNNFTPEPTKVDAIIIDNTSQIVIKITEDKLLNYLHDFIKKYKWRFLWSNPFVLIIPLGISLLTDNFNDIYGLSAENWRLIFSITLLASIMWLIYSIIKLCINLKTTSIEKLILKIKDQDV